MLLIPSNSPKCQHLLIVMLLTLIKGSGRICWPLPHSSSGLGRSPLKAKTGVRFPYGALSRTHLEPHTAPVEQFLAMLRFDKRDKLAELPLDLVKVSARDEFL